MTLPSSLTIVLGMGMTTAMTFGQAVFAPRETALGNSGALVHDSRGFTTNPSGMTGIRDWDFNAGTYISTAVPAQSFVFAGMGVGKRFLENHYLALQYSPGTSIDIIQPATATIIGVNLPADRKFSYAEPFAAAYAYRFSEAFSVGLQGRVVTETVNDPQYQFEIKDTTIVPVSKEFRAITWFGDLSVTWIPSPGVILSALGRGLLQAHGSELPPEFSTYRLPLDRALELGASMSISPSLTIAGGVSTSGTGSAGVEWSPGWNLSLRAGMYGDRDEKPFVYSYAAGIGVTYAFVELDAAYQFFAEQTERRGTIFSGAFSPSSLRHIGLNRYTPDRASISVKATLGSIRESLAHIEGIEMLGGVYPSAYEALAFRPIGKVRVRNIARKPIQARVTFFVDRFMDQPTESTPVYIEPGSAAEIPLTAVFNEQVKNIDRVTIREGTVSVSATVAEEYDDRAQTRVLIHGKNDWDGNVHNLRYFVTTDEPSVLRTSRDILLQKKDSLGAAPKELTAFRNAQLLFNTFARNLMYVSDPKQSADYVQYPAETLKLRGGDCDDMTVCFASLLSSVGISTAFVDVVPPNRPDNSHIYLLFDTGVNPKFGSSIAANPKRYVIRKSKTGEDTIWLPIETTVTTRGFDAAWSEGAQEYFDDVEIGLGLVKGWVTIVDVN
jgi:hypothetical protein